MEHLCPKCKNLLRVKTSKYVVRDKKLFNVMEFICVNPNCENKDQIVEKAEYEQPVIFE